MDNSYEKIGKSPEEKHIKEHMEIMRRFNTYGGICQSEEGELYMNTQ